MFIRHLPSKLAVSVILVFSAQGQDLTPPGLVPAGVSSDDWAGIRAAFEAETYKAKPVAAGFEAFNATQEWLTEFDGVGFLVHPREGDWTWGLALQSYGFEGQERVPTEGAKASAKGQRVTYGWEANLDEWYVNDTRGLEHGYTVQARPQHSGDETAPLTFELNVRGSLTPELHAERSGIGFVDADGNEVVTYSGLYVFDANGIAQNSSFSVKQDRIVIEIEETHATYPLTVDPIGRQTYIKASNTGSGDAFGSSVAISGDIAVVGAPVESSASTGVNGDEANDQASSSGAVYVFHRRLGTWRQEAYLKASNTDALDGFGTSVAVFGGTIVVGAPFEDGAATGVNGNDASNGKPNSGAAYVFDNSGGSWVQVAYLKASNTDSFDTFGGAVTVDRDWLAVSAVQEDGASTGVNGIETSNTHSASGAAYVFGRTGSVWSQVAYVKASNTVSAQLFGSSLSISGDRLVVGAPNEDSGGTDSGAAYVFEHVAGTWGQVAYLKASTPGAYDYFGFAVDASGKRVVVGAPGNDSSATGINGTGMGSPGIDSGAAYVFSYQAGSWAQEAFVKAHNTAVLAGFGHTVAIDGFRLIVGAPDEKFYGPDGDQSDVTSIGSGSTYLFERVGGVWSQLRYQKADHFGFSDAYGTSVAISGKRVLAGAPGEDSRATGIGGNVLNNLTSNSGATYMDDFHPILSTYCDNAVGNSTGAYGIMMVAGTEIIAGNRFYVAAQQIPHNSYGFFISSFGQGAIPMAGGSQGTLCVGGGLPMSRHHSTIRQAPNYYFIFAQIDLTSMSSPSGIRPVAPGETWYFQCWYRDMNPTNTSNYTNAIGVVFE